MSSATHHGDDDVRNLPDGVHSEHRPSSSYGSDSDDSGNHEILQRNGIGLQQVLGRGMFGKVYKGHYHGMTVAVKIAELTAPSGQAKAQLTEAKIATSLQHPNVVHLHKAIVEQVRVARRSLNRRSSMSSRPSSDWEEAHFPTKKYSWAAGADGALSPAGALSPVRSVTGPGAMSPVKLNLTSSAPIAAPIAALSYNRINSVHARSHSDVAMLPSMDISPVSSDSSMLPPPSAFQTPLPPKPPSPDQAPSEVSTPPRPSSRGRQSLDLKERPSGSQVGESRASLGGGRSQSLVTYCCIFIMEFCDAGTLWAALQQGKYHDENGAPKLRALLTTAIEVCEGMAYMHSHRIVHRDLTSGNILLMHEPVAQCAKAKVSDFGLSMLMKPGQDQALAMQHGTLAYMPPELITDDALSFATDVYSFGILLWEMFAAKTPYLGMSEEQIIQRKVHAEVDMESPATAPAEIADLIQRCLHRQCFRRPCFNSIKSSLHTLLATYWSVE